jgi:hypothetical protein
MTRVWAAVALVAITCCRHAPPAATPSAPDTAARPAPRPTRAPTPEPTAPAPSALPPLPRVAPAGGFKHPGIVVTRAQLDFVKERLAKGEEPWTSARAKAREDRLGALSYTPKPFAVVECGAYSKPNVGCGQERRDAAAAYTHALLWHLTGDAAHARKAIEIMNAWSAVVKDHTLHNAPLQTGWAASLWPRAGEIILHAGKADWPAPEVARFKKMLREVYLPELLPGQPRFNGNWELIMIEGIQGIAVFLDDPDVYDAAVAMWRKRVPAYIYMKTDGPLPVRPVGGGRESHDELIKHWYAQETFADGLGQETCRDLGHLTMGFASMVNVAETAWIQGLDLYAEESERIRAGFEFNTQYVEGVPVPAWLCAGAIKTNHSPAGEIVLNHYVGRKGFAMPNTERLVLSRRPLGAAVQIAWETLTHAGVGVGAGVGDRR